MTNEHKHTCSIEGMVCCKECQENCPACVAELLQEPPRVDYDWGTWGVKQDHEKVS